MVRYADLVLEGGGVKGDRSHRRGDRARGTWVPVQARGGTSAGSIVAALLSAGFSGREIEARLIETSLLDFADTTLLDRIPVIGPALSVLRENGWIEGSAFRNWLADVLAERGVVTFGDLHEHDRRSDLGDDRSYRLVVTATDLTNGELVFLPWDYRRLYGLEADEQLVADAVRASISVPFVFEPVLVRSADGSTITLVDGGVLSNFPIDVFDRLDGAQPRWPTFGVKAYGEP